MPEVRPTSVVRRQVTAWLAALLWGALAPGAAAAGGVTEFEVKSALIYKIAKFVRWPEGAFAGAGGVMRLCVIGGDDYGASIEALNGQRLQGLVISVSRLDSGQPATGCQIAVISRSQRDALDTILASLSRAPVLTVSDIDGFAARGGIVGFSTVDSKVSFQINPGAGRRAGLEIGAQLLQFATLVDNGREVEKQ